MSIRRTSGASAMPALLTMPKHEGAQLSCESLMQGFCQQVEIVHLIRFDLEAISGRVIYLHFNQAHER